MEQEGINRNSAGLDDMEQDGSGRDRLGRDDMGRKETGKDRTEFQSRRKTGRQLITRGRTRQDRWNGRGVDERRRDGTGRGYEKAGRKRTEQDCAVINMIKHKLTFGKDNVQNPSGI